MRKGMRRLTTWACIGTLAACGARSALNVEEREGVTTVVPPTDQKLPVRDAAPDATRDASLDAALPPIDAAPPPPDAFVKLDCDSPLTNFIYVVTSTDELYSFYPPSGAVRDIGRLSCPSPTNPNFPSDSHPHSMAVDRKGNAYVIYSDGSLYRVSTKTAACTFSGYASAGDPLAKFGMGFSANATGSAAGTETLFVAGEDLRSGTQALASIDVVRNRQNFVAATPRGVGQMELTGSGDGKLFGFYARQGQPGTFVGELDKSNATLIGEQAFPTINFGKGWAFARYAGVFYMFTADGIGSQSTATKFDPDTRVTEVVQNFPQTIVGAGVSTCAPDQ